MSFEQKPSKKIRTWKPSNSTLALNGVSFDSSAKKKSKLLGAVTHYKGGYSSTPLFVFTLNDGLKVSKNN